MIPAFSPNELVWRFGWMLLHSFWQIALIGLLVWAILRLTQRRSAKLRYGIACAGLALCYLPLVYTLMRIETKPAVVNSKRLLPRPATLEAGLDDVTPATPLIPATETNQDGYFEFSDRDPAVSTEPGVMSFTVITDDEEASRLEQFKGFVSPWLIWLVGVWAAGVCLFAVWNAGGWLLVQRLRRQGIPVSSDHIRQRANWLLERMQIRRTVKFLESMAVEVPVVVGWLKPVVLLPAGLLTSLTPDQLEAVIAHELAHIRRHDYLVNLLQTLTESLLFYHPVIWWLSHRIRIEREYCCDDEAIAASGDRNRYVSALAAVETARLAPAHALSLGGSHDGSTLSRMRRLTGIPPAVSQGWIAGLTTVTLLAVGLVVGWSQPSIPPGKTTAKSKQQAEPEVAQEKDVALKKAPADEIHLDPETFRLDLTYYGGSDKPFYDFSLGRNIAAEKRNSFHLVEPTDEWGDDDFLPVFRWLHESGFFQAAHQVNKDESRERTAPAYYLRVTSGDRVWEEDLGFDLGMLLRLESLQQVLVGLELKSRQAPNSPIALERLLSRLSGFEKLWTEGEVVNDLKLKLSSEQHRFPAGTPIAATVELTNSGTQNRTYDLHSISVETDAFHIFDEFGRRMPFFGINALFDNRLDLRSVIPTLDPDKTTQIAITDLARLNYLRKPGQYVMYATYENGPRSNTIRFEVTPNPDALPDFVGPLLPLMRDGWILVANSNSEYELQPGKNYSKVPGCLVRLQCSPTGTNRDVSNVWLYFTQTRAEPLQNPLEESFLPETTYAGQTGDYHLYAHVDEKSQQRWPDVLQDVKEAFRERQRYELAKKALQQRIQEIQKKNEGPEVEGLQQIREQLLKELEQALRNAEDRQLDSKKQKGAPISLLIRKLDESHGLWMNGIYPGIELPASAAPREVLAEAVKRHSFDQGKIEKYRVIEIRKGITLAGLFPKHEYIAVRIESDRGEKILLMYFEGGTKHWWTRFYDPPELPDDKVEWGKPDQGVQIALSSKKPAWAANETPEFNLRVRNTSEKIVQFIPHVGLCRVEWDGTWYAWGAPVAWDGPATVVPPGKTVDARILLKLVHDDPMGWITRTGRKPLPLTPGKHTIRVELQCEDGPKPVSQPLELTITKAADQPTRNNPRR